MTELDRRRFLKLLGGASAATAFAAPMMLSAFEKKGYIEPFQWARLKFRLKGKTVMQWRAHPWGDEQLLDMLQKYTSLNVDRNWHVASLDKLEEMTPYPFIFMTSENNIEFTKQQQVNFKEYLERGGFIFADDCVIRGYGDEFFLDIRNKVEELFGKKMVKLPNDHPIYRCFYELDGLPHMQGQEHGGWALYLNGRMVMFLSPSDIHCGWCSLNMSLKKGRGWFSKKKGYEAIKMGINIIVYATTH